MPVPYRVAVIGSTNRGNYGHGLDVVWKQLPETEIVAVADDHPEGLARAATRLGATHAYLDYSTML
ncbi:MAG: gfo/Idh/MocA family oxidoreductase, partial [Limisphaerales bacterium]